MLDHFGAQADVVADLVTGEARAAGFSPDDPFEYSLTSSEVPWVEVPDVSLHDGERAELAAGFSIDIFRARVEAAPRGSSVSLLDESMLKREEVLAAIDLSPNVLVEALQVCAGKIDPAWEAVEPEIIQALNDMRDPTRKTTTPRSSHGVRSAYERKIHAR